MYDETLSRQLPVVQDRIAAALDRCGRTDTVRLIAVTKGHPPAAVEAAVRAGLSDVGENRAHELEDKYTQLAATYPTLRWHLIGHLQRNKVRRVLNRFDMIHSLDSPRLARELSKEAVRAGVTVHGLIQVNVSGEESKGGFEGYTALADIVAVSRLEGIHVHGLMTMAPLTEDDRMVRSTFAAARELLERSESAGAILHGRELSMGMSTDYELAVEEGSTMVRIGTTLFGERET